MSETKIFLCCNVFSRGKDEGKLTALGITEGVLVQNIAQAKFKILSAC